MEYPPCVVWYHNIQSETITQRPTLLLCMEFWDFWWVPSVQDSKQCGLANCNACENWIQTSSHSYTGVPFTLWQLFSDDVAVFRCAWRSRGWYCDGKAWCWGIVFHCEEFDASYQDRRRRCSTGCCAPDDIDCKALDDKNVVGLWTIQWKTTLSDIEGICAPHWSRVEWRQPCTTENSCGEIHFAGCSRSMEGSEIAVGMFLVGVGRHRGSQRRFWTIVRWMATQYMGGLFNFRMAERDIWANAGQRTCGVSRT